MKPPTQPQRRLLHFLKSHQKVCGYAPSRVEMAQAMGVTGTAITERLQQLVRKGYIEIAPGIARGIRLLDPVMPAPTLPAGNRGPETHGKPPGTE